MTTIRASMVATKKGWKERLDRYRLRIDELTLDEKTHYAFHRVLQQVEKKINGCNEEDPSAQKTFAYNDVTKLLSHLEEMIDKEVMVQKLKQCRARIDALDSNRDEFNKNLAALSRLVLLNSANNNQNPKETAIRAKQIHDSLWHLDHIITRAETDQKAREEMAKQAAEDRKRASRERTEMEQMRRLANQAERVSIGPHTSSLFSCLFFRKCLDMSPYRSSPVLKLTEVRTSALSKGAKAN